MRSALIAVFSASLFAGQSTATAQEEPDYEEDSSTDEEPGSDEEPGGEESTEDESSGGAPRCQEDWECPKGKVCADGTCLTGQVATKTKKRGASRAFRLGLANGFFFGFGGEIANPEPAYALQLDFGFPAGRAMRWHFEVGFQNLNGYDGLRFSPFVLGYGIPIHEFPIGIALEAEVLLTICQAEVLFDDRYGIALSSGLRGAVVAAYDVGYVSFSPFGFDVRYAYGFESVGIRTGGGANWPLMLTIGLEL